jgi:oxygen-independent coproporphyrinogen-3 oxidase
LALDQIQTILTEFLSLYFHVPFCVFLCDYCDFYSVPLQCGDSIVDRYIDILLEETERRLSEIIGGVTVPSIYVGGGTPSLLGAEGISRLLEGLIVLSKHSNTLSTPPEITVEANPETADEPFLRSCADHGVTRLSLGVQSFDPGFRKVLGRRCLPVRQGQSRRHTGPGMADSPEKSEAFLQSRIAAAAEVFGSGLCLDLICGGIYPENGSFEQKQDMLLCDIDKALSYRPGHVSLYSLTLDGGTPLAARLGKKETPPEDQSDWLWLTGREALINAGFEQYEVSNFAEKNSVLQSSVRGNRCIHNIRYWQMNDWLGVGPSASGTIIAQDGIGLRKWYAPDTEGFLSGKPVLLTEELDRPTVIKETLLMGYRYREGPDTELFTRRFGKTIEETIPRTLEKWENGMNNAVFQDKRMLFLNSFLLDAFMELDT